MPLYRKEWHAWYKARSSTTAEDKVVDESHQCSQDDKASDNEEDVVDVPSKVLAIVIVSDLVEDKPSGTQ